MSEKKTVAAIQPAYPVNIDNLRKWMNEPGALLFLDQLEARLFAKQQQAGAEMVNMTLNKIPIPQDILPSEQAADCIKFMDLFEAMRTGKYEDGNDFEYLQIAQQVNQPEP